MKIKFILLSAVFLVFGLSNSKAQRISFTINSDWEFFKGDTTSITQGQEWEKISVPHTWNADDVMDDEPGYYRGNGWYKKTIYAPVEWEKKEVFLFFEGALLVTDVYINGHLAGNHIGGYTFFRFPISPYLRFDSTGNTENEILIKVNNAHNPDIAPLSGDYSFYGGLYRDVYLQITEKVHFDMGNNASNGIFISTPQVDENTASVHVKGALTNQSSSEKHLSVVHQIRDAKGQLFAEQQSEQKVKAGQKVEFSQDFEVLQNPHLWSIEDPYLYRVVSILKDATTQEKLDEISHPLGFRWFAFDPNEGFFLNGKSVKLIGAARHQDFKGLGSALSDARHIRDVELLKEMGGNFLRIAHYPQDPAILEACDRLGILASIETPGGNHITESEAFTKNTIAAQVEMIRQNYNHPSLIIWAYLNEVLLRPPYENGSEEQKNYFKKVTALAEKMDQVTRKEDPYRYTLIPNHGNFSRYNSTHLTTIPSITGWNIYSGWYSSTFANFAKALDRHHKTLPNQPVMVTEYGADADVRLHSFDPVRFDKTVEYSLEYHKVYLKAMMERPFVAGGAIWNLAEFNSEHRGESTPHVNAKGIMTFDRKPKDNYRFYQANLLKEPYLEIGTKEWNRRTDIEDEEDSALRTHPVVVFSNQETVTLTLNNTSLGSAPVKEGIAEFNVPFGNGLNQLVATAGPLTDKVDIHFKVLPQTLKSKALPFQDLNVSLGDKRLFYDELNDEGWIPEQAYQSGSWGYIGGKVFKMANTNRHSYGSEKNILGTDLDPVFATQRVGIEQFKFDVPEGDYELTLHFAELLSPEEREALVYNLEDRAQTKENFIERAFDIRVNGEQILSHLSNGGYLTPERAVSFKIKVNVLNEEGITLDFESIEGETILNGIQLRKIR